jgi:hypothetical protein
MWVMVLQLIPSLIYNKIRYGRYLDIFVTHAPPWGIHDCQDPAHQGIKAFRWFIKTFQPAYHLHGHIHVYSPQTITKTKLGNTLVMNTYGYRKLVFGEENHLRGVNSIPKDGKMKFHFSKQREIPIISRFAKGENSQSDQLKNLTPAEHLSKCDAE